MLRPAFNCRRRRLMFTLWNLNGMLMACMVLILYRHSYQLYLRTKIRRIKTKEEKRIERMQWMLPSVSSSACTSNKRKELPNRKSQKISKKPKVAPTQNAESEYKEFNDEVRSFMKNISGHYESMSTWMQGTSSRMPQVLDVLGKHGYIGANKYKAAKAICQDALNVDLLFNLDPAEVKEYVDAFI